jgi:hypothetical protein
MPIYNAQTIPSAVGGSTKDPEIAEWLKTGPVLGSHKPIHVQRREHDAFIDQTPPPIGRVESLVLRGPHGTIPVRVYHPSEPGPGEGAALIYLHGGGFIVGSLDQFETAMRRLSEGSGVRLRGRLQARSRVSVAGTDRRRRVRRALAVRACTRARRGPAADCARRRLSRGKSDLRRCAEAQRHGRRKACFAKCLSTRRPRCRSKHPLVSRTSLVGTWIPPACCCLCGRWFPGASTTASPTSRRLTPKTSRTFQKPCL